MENFTRSGNKFPSRGCGCILQHFRWCFADDRAGEGADFELQNDVMHQLVANAVHGENNNIVFKMKKTQIYNPLQPQQEI